MKNNDETILEILQGHKTSKWPAAKLVKIFIASTKAGESFMIKSIAQTEFSGATF